MAVLKCPPTLPATNPRPSPRVKGGNHNVHVALHVVNQMRLKDVKDVNFHLD